MCLITSDDCNDVPFFSGPDAEGTIPTKTVMNKVKEWTVVNNKKPLWLRSPKDCTEFDYSEFYKQTFNAYDEPAAHAHFSVEGNVDFKAMLFLPSEVPYELTRDMFASSARSMRLYVKRVFINDKFEDLIPRWLLFMRGVVDRSVFLLCTYLFSCVVVICYVLCAVLSSCAVLYCTILIS